MIRVMYGGLDLNTSIRDENGATWMTTGLEGWDGPSMRQTVAEPTSKHGGVLGESLLGSRSLELSGVCATDSETAFWASYNRLLALTGNIAQTQPLIVYEPVPKQVFCVRPEPPEINWGRGSSFTFAIPLLALDPLKYELDQIAVPIPAGATVTVTNRGTFQTAPVVNARGTVSLSNLTTGGTISTDLAVPTGTLFDFASRTVKVGNVSHYGKLSPNATWWSLVPGANSIRNQGSAAVTLYFYPAYL